MTDQYADGYLADQMKRVRVGRCGDAHELCAAMFFLASDAGSYVTGVTLPVDGGFLVS